jgi:hypothetical protein
MAQQQLQGSRTVHDVEAEFAASMRLEFLVPRWQQPEVNRGQREMGRQHQNLHNLYLQQLVN